MQDVPVIPLYPRANIEVIRTLLQNEKTSNSTVGPSSTPQPSTSSKQLPRGSS